MSVAASSGVLSKEGGHTTARAQPMRPLVDASTPPVVRWAWLGGGILAFILYVMGRWFMTGHAVPTDPGPDPLPESSGQLIFWVQCVAMALGMVAISTFVVRPWIHERKMTTTGTLYLCWLTLFFQDALMNYTSATLLYKF